MYLPHTSLFSHVVTALILLATPASLLAQTTTTVASGDWNNSSNWDNGVPNDSYEVIVNHEMNMVSSLAIKKDWVVNDGGAIIDASGGSTYNINIENGGTLDMSGNVTSETAFVLKSTGGALTVRGCDTLEVGSLNLENNTTLTVESCATIIVNGDLELKDSHSATVDGYIKVYGDVTANNTSSMSGSGNISATGTVTLNNSSSLFGSTTACSSTPCFYGTGDALPVELMNFDGTYSAEDRQVTITWSTAAEINNDYFEIQRSSDAEQWFTIGMQDGMGHSSTTTNYQFIDQTPETGKNFYRLNQVDFDGQAELSELVHISTESSQEWQIGPNPFSHEVQIQWMETGSFHASVFSYTGQHLQDFNLQHGQTTLSTNAMPAGTYLLVIQDGNGQAVHHQQLIKY